jgi:hypothetical protein
MGGIVTKFTVCGEARSAVFGIGSVVIILRMTAKTVLGQIIPL